MRRRFRLAVLGLGTAVGLSVASGIAGIGVANAGADSYIEKLHEGGINTPRGEYELKEWGYAVCALRARGKTPRQWVEEAIYESALHPPYGLTEQQANFIVDTAIRELCDDPDGPPPYEPNP
ncbi:DUF732 domain-containing protein [Mycobacterium sp. C31M]